MPKTQAPLIYRGEDAGQARYNEEVGLVLREIVESPLAKYSIVVVDVLTTATKVTHLLGKPFKGWFIIDRGNAEAVYRVGGPEPENAATHFYLRGTGAVTVQVLVF